MSQRKFDPTFGVCLAGIRKGHGLAQKAVALKAGVDQSYLAALERGRRPPPKPEVMQRLVEAIKAAPEEKVSLDQALAITKVVRSMGEEERGFAPTLTRIAAVIRLCSAEELLALETLVVGLARRFPATAGREVMT